MSSKIYKSKRKNNYNTRMEKNKYYYYNNNKKQTDRNNIKKCILIVIVIISIILNTVLLSVISSQYSALNSEKNEHKEELKSLEKAYTNYLFLGDSITEYYDLGKYFPDMPVVNSGIAGDTTDDILNDMKGRVYDYNPSKVFLLIGTNDLRDEKSVDEVVDNIKKIIEEIETNRKEAEIYLESIYPVNEEVNKKVVELRNNPDINEINDKIKKYAEEKNITYIDLHEKLINEEGLLEKKYTKDGLHLNEEGYEVVTEELMKYLK